MIPSTCPCCEVLQRPHKGDCTFNADAPGDAATFDEVSALRAEIARLREYALADARCPCCASTDKCEGDCTFAADCPAENRRIVAARTALGVAVKEVPRG